MRDANSNLIPESGGQPFRIWRPALNPALNDGRKWAASNTQLIFGMKL
ncbi:MAG: hypothetical protein R3C26_11740 [Calditrichia bacterium]